MSDCIKDDTRTKTVYNLGGKHAPLFVLFLIRLQAAKNFKFAIFVW